MTSHIYLTYPKKLNKKKSLGFIDIYDLDEKFAQAKALGFENVLIDGLFSKNPYEIRKDLGENRDFHSQIEKAERMNIKLFLRLSSDKKDGKVRDYWKKRGISDLVFGNSFLDYLKDDFKENPSEENFKKIILDKNKSKSPLSLNKSIDSLSSYILNFKNYYIECIKLLAIIAIIRSPKSFIREGEEFGFNKDFLSREERLGIFKFYKKLILIKDKKLDDTNFVKLYKKDKDLLAYLYYKDTKALVVLINLRQKDILLDMKGFLDISNARLLADNISQRRIVSTLNLRAYEGLVFECPLKLK